MSVVGYPDCRDPRHEATIDRLAFSRISEGAVIVVAGCGCVFLVCPTSDAVQLVRKTGGRLQVLSEVVPT